jgi:hypothetical protein
MQGHFNYNINIDIVNSSVTGSGTITQSDSMAIVSTGTTAASTSLLTSRRQLRYQNGVGTNMRFTAIFSAPVSGGSQLIGFGNTTDGLFYGYSGTTFGVTHRNNGVDTFVPQTSWNGDVFDGSGKSGAIMDHTKGNVFEISMQWLGFGAIFFRAEHATEGDFHLCHTIRYSNANTSPSLTNPNFPFYVYASNGGNSTDVWIKTASYAACIEGKDTINTGITNSVAISETTTAIANIITIRNRTTYNSITNRHSVHPQVISIACEGTKPVECQVILNATLGGSPSWTNVSTNNSIVEYDTSATISGGRKLMTIWLSKADSEFIYLESLGWELYPGETLTFYSHSINNSSSDIVINLTWRERV